MGFPFFCSQKKNAATGSRATGDFGEEASVRYLKKLHLRILARNVRCGGHEEIDIVAEDRTTRRYVEVKTRRQSPDLPSRFGTPAEAVTREKQRHLISAARAYQSSRPTKKAVYMDVIEVYLDPEQEEPALLAVRYLRDAFRA